MTHGYKIRDKGWYRESFVLPPELADKQLMLAFEGTVVEAEFYFNGSLMECTFSDYTETGFDISERAYFDGQHNVIAVHIDCFPTEGWWYEGAGLYRHVKLYAKEKLHIAHNGVFVKPVLKAGTENDWMVETKVLLENRAYEERRGAVKVALYDGDERIAEQRGCPVAVPADSETPRSRVL